MQTTVSLFLILTQNYALTHLFGLPGFAVLTGKRCNLLPSAAAVLCLCPLNAVLLYLLQGLVPERLWQPLLLTALILTEAAAADFLIRKRLPEHCHKPEPHLPAAAFSGAVLGIVLLSGDASESISAAFRFGLMQGAGYFLAGCLLQAVMPAVCSQKMPAAFRGWRGMYVCAGLLSMAAGCLSAAVPS